MTSKTDKRIVSTMKTKRTIDQIGKDEQVIPRKRDDLQLLLLLFCFAEVIKN